ncbi:MAG: hypothetical protein HC915_05270 [Anaerolineae bacterium]|nr:hypothetical protein [Anaerolineae bacterium]
MHTRLTDEVAEAIIPITLAMVREMGAPHVVEFLPWAYVEYAPGQYNWHHPDRIIRHAEHQGVHLIARMGFVPGWLVPAAGEDHASPPTWSV